MADKYCKNCGEKLPQDSKFCTNCGSKVDDSDRQVNNTQRNASAESKSTRRAQQVTPKRKSTIKKIGLIAFGLVVILIAVFLILGPNEDTTTPDSDIPGSVIDSGPEGSESPTGDTDNSQLDDIIDSSLEVNIDTELLRNSLGSYGTTLVYEGDSYTSVMKLQDHGENNFTLDISTPHFVMQLDVMVFTENEIIALYDDDFVEVIYKGNRTSNKQLSEGIIRYTDKESNAKLNYEVKMYNNYKDFNTLANTYLGNFDFYYRDFYVLEGSLSQEQGDLINSVIDSFYNSQTSFNISINEESNRDIIFNQNNTDTASYLLNDMSNEILNGYLVESSIKGLQGELLSIHPLSHPDTNIYEGIIYWMLDDSTALILFFEGFQDKAFSVEDSNNTNDVIIDDQQDISLSTEFSGAWENEGELPIITIIDEGSISVGDVSEYERSYSNKTITNTQQGFLVNNITELVLFKMPYTETEYGLNVDVNIYGGEELIVDGNFNYYYVLDSQGNSYECKGFNQPLTMIDKLPSELELLAQLDIDYIMEDQGKLVMETKITIYDDGADDLYDPDPYYGDTYDITKTLRKKS